MRHVKLFENFLQDEDMPTGRDRDFIVGSIISGDGESHEDFLRVPTYRKGIEELIEMIQGFRPEFEREQQSDSHWKMYDSCVFFLGTIAQDEEPEVGEGTRGEVLLENIDVMDRVDLTIYDAQDFDGIIAGLMRKLQ